VGLSSLQSTGQCCWLDSVRVSIVHVECCDEILTDVDVIALVLLVTVVVELVEMLVVVVTVAVS